MDALLHTGLLPFADIAFAGSPPRRDSPCATMCQRPPSKTTEHSRRGLRNVARMPIEPPPLAGTTWKTRREVRQFASAGKTYKTGHDTRRTRRRSWPHQPVFARHGGMPPDLPARNYEVLIETPSASAQQAVTPTSRSRRHHPSGCPTSSRPITRSSDEATADGVDRAGQFLSAQTQNRRCKGNASIPPPYP